MSFYRLGRSSFSLFSKAARKKPTQLPSSNTRFRILSLIQSRNFAEQNDAHIDRDIELIIFDKDGTIISFDHAWLWWVEEFTRGVSRSVGEIMERDMYDVLKYCNKKKTVTTNSPIAYFTNAELNKTLISALLKHSISSETGKAIVQSNWRKHVIEKEPKLEKTIMPLFDVPGLFKLLKMQGIKVAVCTSDSRAPTIAHLNHLQGLQYVDYMICGDDEINQAKPAPSNIINICNQLGVSLQKTAMVGDTIADAMMGRSAEVGTVIGVLSGVGERSDLKPYCDLLLDDCDQIPAILPFNSGVTHGDSNSG